MVRLRAFIRFRTGSEWSKSWPALVDTGAHSSVLPLTIWRNADTTVLGEHYVRGIVPKEDCKLDVRVGWVTGVLLDEQGNVTDELAFRAYFAPTDETPLIIGFKDLLDKFEVCFDFAEKRAYIEST